MNSYINNDLIWTLPTRSFIITQRVISSDNVIYQINTNKINLLKITKYVFQFFQFLNIFSFCLGLFFLKHSVAKTFYCHNQNTEVIKGR